MKNSRKTDKTKNRTRNILYIVFAILGAIALITSKNVLGFERYEYVRGVIFPLWYVALGIGIVGGAIFTVMLLRKHFDIWARIGGFVLVAVVLFFCIGVVFSHLNHFLDSSEPKQYVAVIEKKDKTLHRKSSDDYEFKLTVYGDSFYIEVPRSHYSRLNEGDLYVVEYHKGAFNEPYYIAIREASE
jgi:protein-S-isoprenylcysteine O-methyltransferase Ste14